MHTLEALDAPSKICVNCTVAKPLDQFEFRKETGKLRGSCRQCRNALTLSRYYKDPASCNARTVAWARANKDRVAANQRDWAKRNPDRVKAIQERAEAKRKPQKAEYRKANAERIKAKNAEYRARNADRIAAYNRAYNASNAAAIVERIARCNAAKPELYQQLHKAAKHRRKVRLTNAGPTESFTDREIYERDVWSCSICGEAVDSSLAYPHPRSASLDHIVPIARGGGHTRANVALAHLRCNIRKKDRI